MANITLPQMVVNKPRLYEQVANNLGIDNLRRNSSLFKLIEPLATEAENVASEVNLAFREMFVNTCSRDTLEALGRQLGIPKRSINELYFSKNENVIDVTIRKENEIVDAVELELYREGDAIEVDGMVILFTEAVRVTNNIKTPLSVKVRPLKSGDIVLLEENKTYDAAPAISGQDVFKVTFTINKTIGFTGEEESDESYRSKIIDTLRYPTLGINNVLRNCINEVPGISFITTNDFLSGEALKTAYLHSNRLALTGNDEYLSNVATLALSLAIKEKSPLYSDIFIDVARPLTLTIELNGVISQSVQELKDNININLIRLKGNVEVSIIKAIVRLLLNGEADATVKQLSTFTLDTTPIETINVPDGRFLYVQNVVTR